MTDQTLIHLPEIRLPRDFAGRLKFVEAVENHVRLLGITGRFEPPRFVGYYFAGRHPVVLARHWKITLGSAPLLWRLHEMLDRMTGRKFNLVTDSDESVPDYLVVHDRYDGVCWLWEFEQGRRFVGALQPVENQGGYPAEGGDEGWHRPGL